MIHQLIFAAPKPGMTEAAFQDYWVNTHAVQYASKIPQIRKYLVATRIPFAGEPGEPLWNGVAEIWLDNERDQLASLQTPEFIQGARADEPKWAAFWCTIALDTTAHPIVEGPAPSRDEQAVKLYILVKRRSGIPLPVFQSYLLSTHAEKMSRLPGLRRYLQCTVRDACYGVGETLLDAAALLWFDDSAALDAALASPEMAAVDDDFATLVEPRYVHKLAAREHWILGPDPR